MQTNGANAWPGWPENAAHQAMIDAYPYAPTAEARKALATQIQENAYRVVPYVQFGQWTAPVAYRPALRWNRSVYGSHSQRATCPSVRAISQPKSQPPLA